ncbi:GNAT family N-acetyltransferase [Pseudoxanthobacter sp.]|uniref:GNAT family N-acetyltransferase n=1 Tax=Pseudoxanthobacter sp. TaxID=1925742 RepID=UPI002FE36780
MPATPADDGFPIRVARSLAAIAPAVWDRLANPGWRMHPGGRLEAEGCPPQPFNPFVCHAFLEALEASGTVSPKTGWAPHHLLAGGTDDAPAAAVPAYLKSHSRGEYVFDWSWAEAFERAGGSYYPKLQIAVPFTPAAGPRLLARDAAARQALANALPAATHALGASSAHVTFAGESDMAALEAAGFLPRFDIQYHWQDAGYGSFEGFLAALASRKRKQVKRERREAAAGGLQIVWRTGRDITEADWDAFYGFYRDTGSRKWGTPYLNRRFFSLIGERMAERILLVMALDGGRPIAGALNFIGSDTLFGRYWGAIEDRPFLHFEVCYHQAVEFALARGLARVEAGAQGEHKAARGYRAVLTRSAHFIAHRGLRDAVADFLSRERPAVAAMCDEINAGGPFAHKEDTPPPDFTL